MKNMKSGKRLRILYIITKGNFGGAQRYVYDMATNLPIEDFEPIVAFGGNGPLKEKLESAGVQTVRIPFLKRDVGASELMAFFGIAKIIWKIKPQIVHLNSSKAGGLGGLAVFVLNLFLRIKNLFITHNSDLIIHSVFTAHGWAFKEKRKVVVKKIIEYFSWLTIFLCHQTIVVSKDDSEKIKNFLFVQPKIKLIHNGIGEQIFKDRDEARKILSEKIGNSLESKKFLIGTIAELHKNKGLEYAIEATKDLLTTLGGENGQIKPDDLAYIIIGGGEQRTSLDDLINQKNLGNTVFLAGEYKGASTILKAFDIFLLPSLKEGLPYVLLEAGAAGLPTIATNVGGVPEIIEDMKSGIIVKSKRPKEISEALSFALSHPEKMKEFGEQLKKTVGTNYTLDKMVEETISVYKS